MKQKSNSEFKERLIAFLLLFIIGAVAYWKAFSLNLIPPDSYRLFFAYEKYGLGGIAFNFGDPPFNPVANLLNLFLFNVFGISDAGWIVCSVMLHIINSFLLFLLVYKIARVFISTTPDFFLPCLAAALMFMLSPYQTDPLLWVPAAMYYLYATCFLLMSLNFMISYFETASGKKLFLFHLFFVLAIFCFEAPLVLPLLSLISYVFLLRIGRIVMTTATYIKRVLLVQFLIILLYFVTCKVWLGSWILHYGADVHLNLSLVAAAGVVIKYLAKFFLFYRYLPALRHEFLQNPVAVGLLFAGIVALLYFFYKRIKQRERSVVSLLWFLFIAFLIFLFPVANLDTSFLGNTQADRYGYLPSLVIYPFVAFVFYFVLKRTWQIISVAWILLSAVLLWQTIPLWKDAGEYCERLVENFKPWLASDRKIYVLNMPDNYNWVLTFRGGFEDYIYFHQNKDIRGKMKVIANYAMSSSLDSVHVSRLSEKELLVADALGDKKFLYHGVWANSYSTEHYKVDFEKSFSAYSLIFSETPANAVFLYVVGDKWKKVPEL